MINGFGHGLTSIFFSFMSFGSMAVMIILVALSIYCMVLFIKLARRGIVALDIYNSKNSRKEEKNQD